MQNRSGKPDLFCIDDYQIISESLHNSCKVKYRSGKPDRTCKNRTHLGFSVDLFSPGQPRMNSSKHCWMSSYTIRCCCVTCIGLLESNAAAPVSTLNGGVIPRSNAGHEDNSSFITRPQVHRASPEPENFPRHRQHWDMSWGATPCPVPSRQRQAEAHSDSRGDRGRDPKQPRRMWF